MTNDGKRARGISLEMLELRQMLALIGVGDVLGSPQIFAPSGSQSLTYNATTHALDILDAPLTFIPSIGLPIPILPSTTVTPTQTSEIHIEVATSGALIGGVSGDDFILTGKVTIDSSTYDGVLLKGEISLPGGAFGFGTEDEAQLDFVLVPTGGELLVLPEFAGAAIGIVVNLEDANEYTGSFEDSFTALPKAIVGPIPRGGGPSTYEISGAKYKDLTGNGYTGDDTPLTGTTINLFADADGDEELTGADGSAIATTITTGIGGSYSFTGLEAGVYFVQEVVPSGYLATTPPTGIHVVEITDADVPNVIFANVELSSISGAKFKDLTGDGLTGDDTGLGSTTINLFKDVDGDGALTGTDGASIASTVSTAGTGAYSFAGLLPGKYLVQEIVPAGYARTTPNTVSGVIAVNLATGGTNSTGSNFANAKLAGISGIKFKDLTGNGFSGDDTPLAGTTINLFKDTVIDGVLTPADGGPIATTVSAAVTGAYSFGNLLPGTYFVQEVVPAGYQQTAPSPSTHVVNLSGEDVTGKNFANAKLASISGIKYLDLTGNGITGDDTPFAGVTISLFKDVNNDGFLTGAETAAIATTVTAAVTGAYSFGPLLPGTYVVKETVPVGYQQTAPTGDGFHTVILSGIDCTGRNFANKLVKGSISGVKYLDICGNGLTPDDTPLGGVQIKLYRDVNNDGQLTSADGAALATATTAAGTGAYSFTNLTAGNYFVQESITSGYVRTAPTLSDKYYVPLASGANVSGKDFANAKICDCKDDITCVKYYVDGCSYSTLTGNTHQEATVKVTFTVKAGAAPEKFTLVAYKAPSPVFIASEADEQTIFDIDTGTFGPGTYTLCVRLPDSYYQVDFVCGCAIDRFGPAGSNIFYSAQKRLISYDNAGSNSDIDGLSKGPKYWASAAGQTLIKGLNGGTTSTQLASWLATSFPRLYGTQAGSYNLTGKTNAQVAANILSLYNGGTTKVATAQTMAIAISMWVSTISLGGNTAAIQAAGFRPTAGGLAPAIFNVLNDGAAFDESNYSSQTVLELMKDCNANAVNGLLYAGDSSMRSSASDVLEDICNFGDIDVV